MAKAIHLAGGTKGTKNTLSRSHAAQKSVSGSKAKIGTKPAVRVYKKAAHNPKPGASDVKAITRPNMPNPGASTVSSSPVGHARKWFLSHGMNAPTLHPFDRATHPADLVGSTRTAKGTKKTTPVSAGKHGKVTFQARAAKAAKKPTVLGS